ncbi:hypothetical protein QBC40DRAFT_256932 [Triangularia verruculosa]|uniref:Plastocyanin-like domain-containing protein n=1 Tax=Triangularia verruculosa TaxID=2587418 RepID=A0AAN7AU24_9PEZI|nr:hypothetical protein QBC40DRAFT_256932 [Triangularia verruculosa]
MSLHLITSALLTWAISFTSAVPVEHSKRQNCANGPTARNCWGGFNIDDDVSYTWPDIGVTRSYSFDVGLATLAPDGVSKQMMIVNGQYPGPTIEADWGDNIQWRCATTSRRTGPAFTSTASAT